MSSIDVFSSGSHSAKINYATNLNVNCLSGQHYGQLFAQKRTEDIFTRHWINM